MQTYKARLARPFVVGHAACREVPGKFPDREALRARPPLSCISQVSLSCVTILVFVFGFDFDFGF